MENNIKKSSADRIYYLFALRIIGDFGATIAVPVIIGAMLGQKIDFYYHKTPLFTVIGFVLAAILSATMISRKAKRYGKEYEKLQ